MRAGFSPVITFDKRGEIFSIATGSGACAEHECGSASLQSALCLQGRPDSSIITDIRKGVEIQYPDLTERKSIVFGEKLEFVCSSEEAVLGFTPYGNISLEHCELRIMPDADSTGAWDERSFAFKVRGEKLVKKLAVFAEAVRFGDGIFAGTFLDQSHGGGVCIARKSKLRPEHKALINQAQAKYEASLRLTAASKLDDFHAWLRQNQGEGVSSPGYLWPVWKDNIVDGEVVYALNPGYNVNARYWGPYDLEVIKEWLLGGRNGPLKPIS